MVVGIYKVEVGCGLLLLGVGVATGFYFGFREEYALIKVNL